MSYLPVTGWHCDCRMYSELDENDDQILLPCCWCGDNEDGVPSREIVCPNWDDPDRNDCPSTHADPDMNFGPGRTTR